MPGFKQQNIAVFANVFMARSCDATQLSRFYTMPSHFTIFLVQNTKSFRGFQFQTNIRKLFFILRSAVLTTAVYSLKYVRPPKTGGKREDSLHFRGCFRFIDTITVITKVY